MSDPLQGIRQVLAELELISHGTTQAWNPAGNHGGESEAARPPGELYPPHEHYRVLYLRAATDERREGIIEQARDELAALRVQPQIELHPETEQELDRRIVHDGKGWTVKEVSLSLKVTPTRVRRARIALGVNLLTGESLKDKPPPAAPEEKARELAEQGLTGRQIAMLTGIPQTSLRRLLGRVA